jgi:hypothetical protein
MPSNEGPLLLLACADGAGSASHADHGASLACRQVCHLVRSDLREGLSLSRVERDTVVSWHVRLHAELRRQAEALGCPIEQLACTLLLAVIGEKTAVFSQIGDGVIVTRDGEGYGAVFWPQTGEYINSTNFVTDPEFASALEVEIWQERVDELALLTDGLQPLALHYSTRRTHQPFFAPMFQRLRAAQPGEGLAAALRQFLSCAAVNARTDDDKTLVLATRVPHADAV